ncbi:MAG: hypothetical protein ACF8AM_18250 [Rhodopirellula sp. JB055]|uniref:hypothetical protein n=1 Tax=Rhodopirellula sp. JB055 TaxID=3342846 RepID=UPI00370B4157
METVAGRFEHLEGLFFEWDGSFTWANQSQGWQIDGTVYDNGQAIQYVDLHGRGSSPEGRRILWARLQTLFSTLGTPQSISLMRLPERSWQDLQAFEKDVFQTSKADQ